MMGPETPGTFTKRPYTREDFFTEQIEGLAHMRQLGADWIEALIACLGGHRMTPDLAALCITTYWRRYTAIANYQENRGAAITIQAAFRGLDHRVFLREKADAASRLQALMRGRLTRGTTDEARESYRAAARLQAVWRAHLAHAYVERLRWKSKSKLQRTFSWSNRSKKKKKPETPSSNTLDALGIDGGVKRTVRRSMSFDRFTRGTRKLGDEGKPAEPAKPTTTKQLLFILLHRGPTGLGLELDATNTVFRLVPGGAAEVQGYFKEGDTIASVDGMPLRGRLLQDVMDRSKSSYAFDVWRFTRVEPETPAKVDKPVRRAFSFDRKRR